MKIDICLVFWSIVLINGYEDLSANKKAHQSSTPPCINDSCNAKYAVDGKTGTCMRTEIIGTSSPRKSVWWYVDLGHISSIHSIRIQFEDYGRTDNKTAIRQRGRFAGFSLYVSNSSSKENGYRCYKDGPELPPLDFMTTCVTHGRFVIFYNERLEGIQYPTGYINNSVYTELCEVTVTGCENPSVYGYDCDLPCPENCQERRCYIVNGTCLGCRAGWIGEFCNNSCANGFYGLECRTLCAGHCRDNKPCNQSTGECDEGCASGWTGSHCAKQCLTETYGPDCRYNCSRRCSNGVPCNRITGRCSAGCKPGYTGDLCDKVCSLGFFGLNCTEQCSDHCRYNQCNHENGYCEHGCQDGFIGRKCNKTCDEGWHGVNCSIPCSRNCVNQTCHHIEGNCSYGCRPGWMGLKCNKGCLGGMFGKDCIHHCSGHCFNNMTCHPVNGSCTEGCSPGYVGDLCNEPCHFGSYGLKCAQICSDNCHDACNHVDGSCVCSKGAMGSPNCDEECPFGYYGLNCGHKCSEHCNNKTCDIHNGTCSYGCKESYGGPKCDQTSLSHSNNAICNVPDAYIAGLSLSVFINVLFAMAFVVLFRRFHKGDQEKNSSQYITSNRAFPQSEGHTNDNHNYQELNMAINSSYQNMTLRDYG